MSCVSIDKDYVRLAIVSYLLSLNVVLKNKEVGGS